MSLLPSSDYIKTSESGVFIFVYQYQLTEISYMGISRAVTSVFTSKRLLAFINPQIEAMNKMPKILTYE